MKDALKTRKIMSDPKTWKPVGVTVIGIMTWYFTDWSSCPYKIFLNVCIERERRTELQKNYKSANFLYICLIKNICSCDIIYVTKVLFWMRQLIHDMKFLIFPDLYHHWRGTRSNHGKHWQLLQKCVGPFVHHLQWNNPNGPMVDTQL